MTAHCIPELPGLRDHLTSAYQVGGHTRMCHHTRLIFVSLVEEEFHHVAQDGLKLLGSSDSPAAAPKVLGLQACTTMTR